MRKNYGFTLIELLAVIIILTMIALITTPVVMDLITNSKIESAELSAFGYLDAFEKQMIEGRLNKKNYPDGIYAVKGEFLTTTPVSYKGTGPSNGTITVSKRNVVTALLCVEGYPIKFENGEAKYEEEGTTCDNDIVFEDSFGDLVDTNKMKEPLEDTSYFYGR